MSLYEKLKEFADDIYSDEREIFHKNMQDFKKDRIEKLTIREKNNLSSDYCWCGSGKKRKVCHYKDMKKYIDDEKYVRYVANKTNKMIRKYKGYCFIEGCRAKPQKSHSLQKNGILKKTLKGDDKLIVYNISENTSNNFKEAGINKASTFLGFCHHHDSAFSCFEDHNFVGNEKQNFELYKRAYAYHYHEYESHKMISHDFLSEIISIKEDKKNIVKYEVLSQVWIIYYLIHEKKRNKGREIINNIDKNKQYNKVTTHIIKMKKIDFIASSGVIISFPILTDIIEEKYDGEKYKSQKKVEVVSINIIEYEDERAVVFSFISEECFLEDTLNYMYEQYNGTDLARAIILLIIFNVRNTYYSKKWHNGLSEDSKLFLNEISKYQTEILSDYEINLKKECSIGYMLKEMIDKEIIENKLKISPEIIGSIVRK